ncbi:His-tRNA synth like protein [Babesia gibsoni]|uniref:histidine--tRNA ligase n=1 Tax=Babesia gibsoni TaxID=33632 RepID=A0AAD8UVQ9_BABGI|nr:His-tRNA synth like protein [Babesia gibsoni]
MIAYVLPFSLQLAICVISVRGPKALGVHTETLDNVALHTVRGGQYFLPAEQLEQRRLQEEWDNVSGAFGFAEYSLGVLAHAELFGKGEDEKNDEHRNELYTFSDRKGRRLALRGDITPQFMAMLKAHREGATTAGGKFTLSPPQVSKWYTKADCWRYEHPGHCRRRNHLQWTCDIVGITEEAAEVELLTMLIYFFQRYNLSSKDVAIHLNHHNSTSAILRLLGRDTDDGKWMHNFVKVMDKYRKLPRDAIAESLMVLGLKTAEIEKLFEIIANCNTITDLENIFQPESEFVKNMRNIYNGLDIAGYADWLTIDLSVVRGNDYYTGAVFECFDRLNPHRRAIAGGGRYDNYFSRSEDSYSQLSYAVGFGMGNVAIVELLRDRGITEQSTYADVVLFTPPIDLNKDSDNLQSINTLLDTLRKAGLKVHQYYKTKKWYKALDIAERAGASFFINPQVEDGTLTYQVHDLGSKTKKTFPKESGGELIDLIVRARETIAATMEKR